MQPDHFLLPPALASTRAGRGRADTSDRYIRYRGTAKIRRQPRGACRAALFRFANGPRPGGRKDEFSRGAA